MHINFAFEVINTVRAESPELFDDEFEKQIVAIGYEKFLEEEIVRCLRVLASENGTAAMKSAAADQGRNLPHAFMGQQGHAESECQSRESHLHRTITRRNEIL